MIFDSIKPFHATGLFLHSLKNERIFSFLLLGGIENDQWHDMG